MFIKSGQLMSYSCFMYSIKSLVVVVVIIMKWKWRSGWVRVSGRGNGTETLLKTVFSRHPSSSRFDFSCSFTAVWWNSISFGCLVRTAVRAPRSGETFKEVLIYKFETSLIDWVTTLQLLLAGRGREGWRRGGATSRVHAHADSIWSVSDHDNSPLQH